MKKEYRMELSILRKSERKLLGDLKRLEQSVNRQSKVLTRSLVRGRVACGRELDRIERRRAILEGRLS